MRRGTNRSIVPVRNVWTHHPLNGERLGPTFFNTTSKTKPNMNMQQSIPMPDCRPESHNRTSCNDTLQSSHTFPERTQSAGSSRDTTYHHPTLSILNSFPPLMDNQESVEGRYSPSRDNTEHGRPGIPHPTQNNQRQWEMN